MLFFNGFTAYSFTKSFNLNPACLWYVGVFFYGNKILLFIAVLIV